MIEIVVISCKNKDDIKSQETYRVKSHFGSG